MEMEADGHGHHAHALLRLASPLVGSTSHTPHVMTNADEYDSWFSTAVFPAESRAVPRAREWVRTTLAGWGLAEPPDLAELAEVTELLAGELVGNAIRHASGPVEVRLLYGRSLLCEVFDTDRTLPEVRTTGLDDEGGRGLQLVCQLTENWGACWVSYGKVVWFEQTLPPM